MNVPKVEADEIWAVRADLGLNLIRGFVSNLVVICWEVVLYQCEMNGDRAGRPIARGYLDNVAVNTILLINYDRPKKCEEVWILLGSDAHRVSRNVNAILESVDS